MIYQRIHCQANREGMVKQPMILRIGLHIMSVFNVFLYCSLGYGCHEKLEKIDSVYRYIEPNYELVQLHSTNDTLSFPLDDYASNAILSFNVFSQNGVEYIAFYDERFRTINIYELCTQNLLKKVSMKSYFGDRMLYKTTAYVKNFDSIFVINKTELYLLDTAGLIKKTNDFIQKPYSSWARFKNTSLPVFKGSYLYAAARSSASPTSFKELSKWQVLYKFDIQSNSATLHYHFPEVYRENLYGQYFLDYSYCYNNRGNFVFSFPADSAIYESDLATYHVAYYGKSQFQSGVIEAVPKENLLKGEAFKSYLTRDSYGAIYFDSSAKRYLRVARRKISEVDYKIDRQRRKQTVLIFDERFKIIGESTIDSAISLNYLFFVADGSMYVRTRLEDEYALRFVRLAYGKEVNIQSRELVKSGK